MAFCYVKLMSVNSQHAVQIVIAVVLTPKSLLSIGGPGLCLILGHSHTKMEMSGQLCIRWKDVIQAQVMRAAEDGLL